MSVYFIAVKNMDGMVGRGSKKRGVATDGPKKIPFETSFATLAELEEALKKGPVSGSQLVYEPIPDSWQRKITRRISMRITQDNCASIMESRIEFVEPEAK